MSSHTWQASQDHRRGTGSARRYGGAILCAASAALLAAMPTASALAQPATQGSGAAAVSSLTKVRRMSTPGELLPAGQLEGLLAGLPLSDLSTTQLAHYLAGLEEIGLLAGLKTGHGTKELGLPSLEEGLSEGIKQLGGSATIGELENTAALLPSLEGKLNGLLSSLLGSALDGGQKQQLSEALEKLDLTQLVGSLLGSAKEPAQLSGFVALAEGLIEALGPNTVTGLLGSTLEGPFTPSTVEGTAKELGTTSEALSEELGQLGNALSATTTMLTAPVSGGKLLAIAPAVKGLAMGLLEGPSTAEESKVGEEKSSEEKGGGEKGAGSSESGSGSGTGKGGSGGSGQGGSGGAGAPGSSSSGGGPLTLVVNLPGPAASTSTTVATPAAATKPGKVQIRSWRTKGALATLVLQVPAAGQLTLRGRGLKSKTVRVAKAKRVTLTVKLSRAATASLRRRRQPLKRKLVASFTSTTRASSSTAVTLTFG